MHEFAIVVLFGLGIAASVVFLDRLVARLLVHELWPLLAVGAGVGLAWLADFNLWALWDIPVREERIGITLTGLALGGVAYCWREVLGFFAGLHRKYEDEAMVLERREEEIRRVA